MLPGEKFDKIKSLTPGPGHYRIMNDVILLN